MPKSASASTAVERTPRENFDFWKVTAISSLAVASVNLGLLYFLTMEIHTLIFSDALVINTHPTRSFVEPISSESAETATLTPTPTKKR